MPAQYDTSVVVNDPTAQTTRNINTLTIAANSNRVLYFIANIGPAGTGITSITWNGVALTKIYDDAPADTFAQHNVWRLVNPASGNQTLTITSPSGTVNGLALSVYDADQVTADDGVNAAAGNAISATSAVNDLLIVFSALGGGASATQTPSTGTEISDTFNNGASNETNLAVARVPGAATINMTYDQDASAEDQSVFWFNINAAAASWDRPTEIEAPVQFSRKTNVVAY